jgi:hypothetical protein
MHPINGNGQRGKPQPIILMCATCLFWTPDEKQPAGKKTKSGACHRKAPGVNPSAEHPTVWPLTTGTDYCGEYVPDEPQCTVKAYCHHRPQDCPNCKNSKSVLLG